MTIYLILFGLLVFALFQAMMVKWAHSYGEQRNYWSGLWHKLSFLLRLIFILAAYFNSGILVGLIALNLSSWVYRLIYNAINHAYSMVWYIGSESSGTGSWTDKNLYKAVIPFEIVVFVGTIIYWVWF